MKGPHSNEQTSLGVLMTPAQKAAAEIYEWDAENIIPMTATEYKNKYESIIQSALDAVKEQCKQQELELAAKWRKERAHTYASENADLYRGFDNGRLRSAEELESLAKENAK